MTRIGNDLHARTPAAAVSRVLHRLPFRLDLAEPGAALHFHDLIAQQGRPLECASHWRHFFLDRQSEIAFDGSMSPQTKVLPPSRYVIQFAAGPAGGSVECFTSRSANSQTRIMGVPGQIGSLAVSLACRTRFIHSEAA